MDVRKTIAIMGLAACMTVGTAQHKATVTTVEREMAREAQTDEAQIVPVTVNGRPLTFPDQQPLLIRDEVMVPMRGVFEHMDAQVVWKPGQRKVIATRGSTTVVLPIGKPLATVNGENYLMDSPPFIVNGRTMVPLRFLTYTLHAGVVEINNGQVVNIIPNHGVQDLTEVPHSHLSP